MTHVTPRDHAIPRFAATPVEPGVTPDPSVLRLRAVHRAVADLRRGTPVLLEGDESLVVLPAETAGARGLAEFAAVSGGPPVLLLAPARAAAVLRRPVEQGVAAVALTLPRALLEPAALRSLADPTADQLLPPEPVVGHAPALAGAALALTKLARVLPAAIVAPLRSAAPALAADLALLGVAAADVLAYPHQMAAWLVRVAEAEVPLEDAPDARVVAFRGPDAGIEHLAILVGRPEAATAPPLVRIHSECFTGDLLGSLRCDCGPQLRGAIKLMAEDGTGVLLYLAQEGRGIGLVNKLRAYRLQDRGLDTLDANRALGWGADERTFLVAATMLEELGLREVRLLTNNPDKVAALAACGLTVHRQPHAFAPNGVNDRYLATKAARFGHLFG
jgi:GTP cyclohydrolase II